MKSAKLQLRFTAVTILLILVIVFCIMETVKSQRNEDQEVQNKYYAAVEKECIDALRDELNRQGYYNSGITVRWVVGEDNTRYYTVLIHHNRINNLDADKQAELLKALSNTGFEDESCSFCYVIEKCSPELTFL